MDFARLHSRAYLIAKLHFISDAVIGERVTRLVGEHIDIARSAIEIREDERRLVFEYLRAVAARSLALCAQDIHEGVVIHKVYELPRLGAHLLIHFLSRGEDILGRTVGLRVALFKGERVVVYFHVIYADAFFLHILEAADDRHYVAHDARAESRNILCVIAVARLAAICKLGEGVEAELFCNACAAFYKAVKNSVELIGLRHIEPALRLVCRAANVALGVLFICAELGKTRLFAVEIYLRRGYQLLVFARKLVFLLQIRDYLWREAPARKLRVDEHQLAVFLFKLRAKRASEHRLGELLLALLNKRGVFVVEVVLFLIELIEGVDGVTDIGYRAHRLNMGDYFFTLRKGFLCLSESLCCAEAFRRRIERFSRRLDIYSLIWHITEFHINSSVGVI